MVKPITPWVSRLSPIRDGEEVRQAVANRLPLQDAQRAQHLKDRLDALQDGQALYLRGVALASSVQTGNAVYWDPAAQEYKQALAALQQDTDTQELRVADSAYVTGVVIQKQTATRDMSICRKSGCRSVRSRHRRVIACVKSNGSRDNLAEAAARGARPIGASFLADLIFPGSDSIPTEIREVHVTSQCGCGLPFCCAEAAPMGILRARGVVCQRKGEVFTCPCCNVLFLQELRLGWSLALNHRPSTPATARRGALFPVGETPPVSFRRHVRPGRWP